MSVCELCGKEALLITAIVEGTQMEVCQTCGKFGKIIRKPVHAPKKIIEKKEVIETITPNFAILIRQTREKTGETQADFAKRLNEKESIIQKLENGSFKPSIETARKLEKLLKIKLVEVEEEIQEQSQKRAGGPLTIGDIINIK